MKNFWAKEVDLDGDLCQFLNQRVSFAVSQHLSNCDPMELCAETVTYELYDMVINNVASVFTDSDRFRQAVTLPLLMKEIRRFFHLDVQESKFEDIHILDVYVFCYIAELVEAFLRSFNIEISMNKAVKRFCKDYCEDYELIKCVDDYNYDGYGECTV